MAQQQLTGFATETSYSARGASAGTPARPDGLTVPGCAYNPLDCSVGAAPLPLPQLPYLGSPGRGGSHEQDKLDYLSDPTQGQAALSRRQPFRTALTILPDC